MEERKKAKGRIKAELGFKVADWNVLMRMADLEEDSRDELFGVLRAGFAALEIGGQASFLDAIAPEPAPEPKKKSKRKTKTIAEEIAETVIQHGIDDEVISEVDVEEYVESEEPLEAA